MKIDVSYDPYHLFYALGQIVAKTKAASPEAMRVAIEEFKDDCINEPPKCPKKYGGLIESHKTFVMHEGSTVVGILHVQAPFARSLHEGVVGALHYPVKHWTEPGSGPDWVRSKMIRYKMKYVRTASNELHKRTSGIY